MSHQNRFLQHGLPSKKKHNALFMLAKELGTNMSWLSQIAADWRCCSQRDDILQMDHGLTCSPKQFLLVVWTFISMPQVNIAPYCSSCFVSLWQFLPLSSTPFSFLYVYSPHSLGVQEGMLQCGGGGDLTQQVSWLWLCRAIYKWLVINPRPTLPVESHHLFSPSRTFACIWMFQTTDMCLQLWMRRGCK